MARVSLKYPNNYSFKRSGFPCEIKNRYDLVVLSLDYGDYDTLDKVIKLYFEENIDVEEIKYLCPGKPVEQIVNTILRAEFKRKQMTTGIKLSSLYFVKDIDYPVI